MRVGDLVLDMSVYPRKAVDEDHVNALVEAIRGGANLPPVVACKTTHRLVDGFHRVVAVKRLRGDDCEVSVVENDYPTDDDLFLEAIRYNAAHGLRLGVMDQQHCILRAKALGIADKAIALTLSLSESRIGALTARAHGKPAKLTTQPATKPKLPSPAIKRCPTCGRKIAGDECLACQSEQQVARKAAWEEFEDDDDDLSDLQGIVESEPDAENQWGFALDSEAALRLQVLQQARTTGNEVEFYARKVIEGMQCVTFEPDQETKAVLTELRGEIDRLID